VNTLVIGVGGIGEGVLAHLKLVEVSSPANVAEAPSAKLLVSSTLPERHYALPIAGTELCEAAHFQYHVSGRLQIRMEDGSELIAEAGDITSIPSGHDAWVLGDEPVVLVDWYGASNYAKSPDRSPIRT